MSETRRCPQCGSELVPGAPEGLCERCAVRATGSVAGPLRESSRPTLKETRERIRAPEPSDLAGHFPQLEIVELLGQGGMGYVYKARQPGLDRLVALKLLPPHIEPDRSFAERFAREARALARLNHPNIVMVHDSGEVDGLYYFVMEFIDGLNLRQLLQREHGRVTANEALRIVDHVCDALEYAHEEGVIHRDIKPENILLDRKGRVKIADFGLAKLMRGNGDRRTDYTLTAPQQTLGTLHYMAPEQTERPREVDHRADIYAVGVVLYEMLTGELPLGRFPLPSELSRVDTQLDEIVLRALEKDPERRFQRASEVRTAVDSALSGVTPAAPPTAPPSSRQGPWPAPSHAAPSGYRSSLHIDVDFPAAYERVRSPANWLFLSGVLSLVLYLPPAIVFGVIGLVAGGGANQVMLVLFSVGSVAAALVMLGAQKMKRLENRNLSLLACLLSVLPVSPACWLFLTLPLGLWALFVLGRRDVVAAFEAKVAESRG